MKIAFLNENGNASPKVREQVKAQVMSMLKSSIAGLEGNADKGLSLYIADDTSTGKPIYAHLSCVISTREPSEQTSASKPKTKGKKKTEEVVLPDLFATTDEEE